VTITHTAGVFALGIVTLFASQYVVAERLFPYPEFCIRWERQSVSASLCVVRRGAASTRHHDRVHEHTLTTFITTIMHTSIRTTIMFMGTHTSIHTADAALPSTAGSRWHSSHLAQPPSARYFRRIAACPQHSWFTFGDRAATADTVCCLSSLSALDWQQRLLASD